MFIISNYNATLGLENNENPRLRIILKFNSFGELFYLRYNPSPSGLLRAYLPPYHCLTILSCLAKLVSLQAMCLLLIPAMRS